MFDTIFGLPVHALVVHAVVVLVPLTAAGVLLIAVRPQLRQTTLGLIVGLLAVGCLPLTYVARQSGPLLKERLHASGVVAEQISHHEKFGKVMIWPVLAMAVLVVALLLLDRGRRSRSLVTAVAVLAVLGAGTSTVYVALTGHSGSVAVWRCTITPEKCRG